MEQHRLTKRVREMGRNTCDWRGLRFGEAERVVGAMQTQVAPAFGAHHQRRAQLVAEPEWVHDGAERRLAGRSDCVAASSEATWLGEVASSENLLTSARPNSFQFPVPRNDQRNRPVRPGR